MYSRRSVLALVSAFVISGCAAQDPLLQEGAAEKYALNSVSVDVSELQGVKGRSNEYSTDKVQRDLHANLKHKIGKRARGNQPADVHVKVKSVYLVSPGQSFLVGGTSTIRGVLTVTDATTGEVILPETDVTGTAKGGYAPGGLIGAISTRNVDSDYLQTVAGFSADVERNLFGNVADR